MGCIAAGNTALIKPASAAANVSKVMSCALYQERKPLFERYVNVSTAFFTADNHQAHQLVDQADALVAQFR